MMHTLALSLLSACIGLLLALALRRPARRLAGPGPAFTLWALPVLLAVMPLLPQRSAAVFTDTTLTVLPAILVQPQTQAAVADGGAFPWPWLWLAGGVLVGLRTMLHYLRIRRATRPLPEALARALPPGLPPRVLAQARMHEQGPAVLWGWPNRLLLPADFAQRFDAAGRTQVLAHERAHLARRDPLWSLLAEIVLAALWFFPPAWWAMSRFRLDQELACDAAVLRRTPDQVARYARALVDHCQGGAPHPVLNTWFSASQLKERLMMIQHPRSLLRRPAGYAILTLLLAGTALAVQAALPGQASTTPGTHASVTASTHTGASIIRSSRIRNPPRYPPQAIKKKAEGKVGLLIQVGTDGKPLDVRVDFSSGFRSLDQAAAKAATAWRFKPATRHGKPVKSWTREHVVFSLDNPLSTDSAAARVVPASKALNPPDYPPAAIKNHEQGTVVLKVHVDSTGRPTEVTYIPEDTHASARLIAAARNAALRWHFHPGSKDGKPVGGWVRVPVTFRLNETKPPRPAPPESTVSGKRSTAHIILLPASATSSDN